MKRGSLADLWRFDFCEHEERIVAGKGTRVGLIPRIITEKRCDARTSLASRGAIWSTHPSVQSLFCVLCLFNLCSYVTLPFSVPLALYRAA